jgi:hypothetical protein
VHAMTPLEAITKLYELQDKTQSQKGPGGRDVNHTSLGG